MGFTTTSGELEISEKDYQALIQAANSRSQMREGNNDMQEWEDLAAVLGCLGVGYHDATKWSK